jgi:hypothetical protein
MKRCLAEGSERFELLVAAAVLANNLLRIASLLAQLLVVAQRAPHLGNLRLASYS